MSECIRAMEQMFVHEKDAISEQPPRIVTRIDPDSLILCMAAYSSFIHRYAVKIITEYKKNPINFSMPIQSGVVFLLDTRSSRLLAELDSHAITEIRTGAVCGLATKLLARKNCKIVGVIGSGSEARRLLEAVLSVSDGVERAKVYSRDYSNAKRFAEEMAKKFNLECEAHAERERTLKDADILIVATNSKTPVTRWEEIPAGCHINSIGTFANEIDRDTIVNSNIFVDSKQGVMTEANDVAEALRSSNRSIRADLSELLLGIRQGRVDEKEVTLFKSVGFALQDVYASSFVYDKVASVS
jgi:ornithine cyclodeaminase